MTLWTPVFLQPTSGDADLTYTGQLLRNLMVSSFLGKDTGFQGEEGVLGGTSGVGFHVVQHAAGANFSVDVASGKAVIHDDEITNGGAALVWNDATYNLSTPNPPATGADLHRVVLQMRNKLENGTYTTYDFIPSLVVDTTHTSTLPAQPPSAVTLASVAIAAGQANVSNSNITDYREQCGAPSAYKAADTARTHNTSVTNDPDLQLNLLASNAVYEFHGSVIYTGDTTTNGDIQHTFNTNSCSGTYVPTRMTTGGNWVAFAQTLGTSVVSGSNGASSLMGISLQGTIATTSAPCSAIFAWAQNTSSGTATTVKAGSFLRARRIS